MTNLDDGNLTEWSKRANTSFTYLGSYADSRIACQLLEWQLPRGFENMKLSAGDVWMEGFRHLFKCLETSPLNSPPVSRRSWPCVEWWAEWQAEWLRREAEWARRKAELTKWEPKRRAELLRRRADWARREAEWLAEWQGRLCKKPWKVSDELDCSTFELDCSTSFFRGDYEWVYGLWGYEWVYGLWGIDIYWAPYHVPDEELAAQEELSTVLRTLALWETLSTLLGKFLCSHSITPFRGARRRGGNSSPRPYPPLAA